uniref:Uncharacterized protein n=1 Tax=Cacopsylla melanoneura TaxID=428564 RepID=A0A8D8WA83_9HEMI
MGTAALLMILSPVLRVLRRVLPRNVPSVRLCGIVIVSVNGYIGSFIRKSVPDPTPSSAVASVVQLTVHQVRLSKKQALRNKPVQPMVTVRPKVNPPKEVKTLRIRPRHLPVVKQPFPVKPKRKKVKLVLYLIKTKTGIVPRRLAIVTIVV